VLESFAFSSGDTDGIIGAETAPGPRQHKLDAFVADELTSLQQAQDAMAKQRLNAAMVEIGYGHPLTSGIPSASGTKSMDVWMKSSRFSESLHDRDHAWAKAVVLEGGRAHELP
jgi:hypothetical protein